MSGDPMTGDQSKSTADAIPMEGGGTAIPATTAESASLERPAAEEPGAAATGEATAATAAATTAEATAATTAEPGGDAAATTAAATTAAATTAAPAVPARRFRPVALMVARRLVRFAFALTLFGLGAYAGWQVFTSNQPAAPVTGDPAVVGVPAPPIVVELVNAIAADDSDAIRAALDPQIFSNYTADLENFGIMRVEGVETLGTYSDGARSATALVIHGRDAERNPFSINLVVLTQDGQIVRLR